ncbi:alpha-N-acetylneuraminide alpha-2,8-sialyltransferase-like [Ptychodera flava]|uniref:alpha-N-acetylneuraminide alpha-2,8-sialyltransferase-like n=1 Tax=Ptychodera flava TaxID=63121 RepID=UPI00396A1B8E
MIPKRPLVRCAKSLGKSALWIILIVNIVIFMKVLSKGLMHSNSDTVYSHDSRHMQSVSTTSKSESRKVMNETFVIMVANTDANNNMIGVDDDVDESIDISDGTQPANETKNSEVETDRLEELQDDVQKVEPRLEELKKPVELAEIKKIDISINCSDLNIQSERCKKDNLTNVTNVVRTMKKVEIPWFKKEWRFNSSAAAEFRNLLEQECHTSELFLATQKNVMRNTTLPYEGEPRKRLLITTQVHSILPEVMPYSNVTFKKCSIVGSSGILLGSKCGQAIDDSDFVIRMNLPNIYNYTADVGTRTDFVTCNPTLVRSGFAALKTKEARQDFINFLQEFGNSDLYMPAFAFKTCTEPSFKVLTTLRATGRKVLFAHPSHMWLVKKFWTEKGVNAVRISSGMLLFTIAMSLCEELHLYGFWPFDQDIVGRHVYYHYFDKNAYMLNKKKRLMHWHEMPSEFALLKELHMKGAINLHVQNCTAPAL